MSSEAFVPEEEHARHASDVFKLLTDPTRIKILWLLHHGERSVGELASMIGVRPTVVSQHLGKLRLAGLVVARREATFAFYSATSDHVHDLLAEALGHAEHSTGTRLPEGHRYRTARDGHHAHEPEAATEDTDADPVSGSPGAAGH